MSAWPYVAAIATIAAVVSCSSAVAADTARKDHAGAYVLKVSEDVSLCKEVAELFNSLPRRDLRQALIKGQYGFLHWEDTKFVESEIAGAAKSYFGASRIVVHLDGGSQQQTVFRLTNFDRYGQESESLFLVPAGEKTPVDGSEFKAFLVGRSPVYGNTLGYEYVSRLQELHPNKWKEWDMSGNVSISAFTLSGKPRFLAAKPPRFQKILIFNLDSQGRQRQHCIITRS
jgi:hypothetical protein